jgi:hypothetical protein
LKESISRLNRHNCGKTYNVNNDIGYSSTNRNTYLSYKSCNERHDIDTSVCHKECSPKKGYTIRTQDVNTKHENARKERRMRLVLFINPGKSD